LGKQETSIIQFEFDIHRLNSTQFGQPDENVTKDIKIEASMSFDNNNKYLILTEL